MSKESAQKRQVEYNKEEKGEKYEGGKVVSPFAKPSRFQG